MCNFLKKYFLSSAFFNIPNFPIITDWNTWTLGKHVFSLRNVEIHDDIHHSFSTISTFTLEHEFWSMLRIPRIAFSSRWNNPVTQESFLNKNFDLSQLTYRPKSDVTKTKLKRLACLLHLILTWFHFAQLWRTHFASASTAQLMLKWSLKFRSLLSVIFAAFFRPFALFCKVLRAFPVSQVPQGSPASHFTHVNPSSRSTRVFWGRFPFSRGQGFEREGKKGSSSRKPFHEVHSHQTRSIELCRVLPCDLCKAKVLFSGS